MCTYHQSPIDHSLRLFVFHHTESVPLWPCDIYYLSFLLHAVSISTTLITFQFSAGHCHAVSASYCRIIMSYRPVRSAYIRSVLIMWTFILLQIRPLPKHLAKHVIKSPSYRDSRLQAGMASAHLAASKVRICRFACTRKQLNSGNCTVEGTASRRLGVTLVQRRVPHIPTSPKTKLSIFQKSGRKHAMECILDAAGLKPGLIRS